ncbi:efflux RND transporter periplasmic adaptor subunit [Halieaceae bacterium IMCC14734]|uniref:Efflux RND transporter periplasmic adaptor subunit n=1 Tax=Candidatus Litorirhabdus singularis TaxID=2518993 RepID=A0ABT3TIM6_9GAMM|nr:efflux RND transporter periplasmic adaptor subunit [Candidatus Litorirhabdus singularis]MCX2981601.1 efflux RND transporter periplasmic adaptor subunit [Candidatus Litorirhabdus singularis]
MRWNSMVRILGLLLIAGVCLAGWLLLADQDPAVAGKAQRPPVPVTVWTVQTRPFSDRVAALGTLRAWESVVITASVTETIDSLHFEDGQRVLRGALLARLQQSEEAAALREQQAMLAEQEREVARLEDLARRNQVAETEVDQRKTLAAIARSKIAQSNARIADRTITAPFDGVLGLRQVSAGALISPGEGIVTLDDLSRMRLDFTVPSRSLAFLIVGQPVMANTAAYSDTFSGVVSAIDSRVNPDNRSLTARARFDNGDGRLRPGMLMTLILQGPERQALVIPEQALVSRAKDHFVWLLEGDQATRVAVQLGSRIPGWVEVTAGLEVGEQVVHEGVARLRGEQALVERITP